MGGGSAIGQAVAIALGAALVATSGMSGGSAVGASAGRAGGASLAALSAIVGGTAVGGSAPAGGSTTPIITVPAHRIAQFASRSRVVVFDGKAPVSMPKAALDELYVVGDFTKDLGGSNTTAANVTPLLAGVTLLEGPSIQGNHIVVKLGGFDTTPGARNFFTFRVASANGEIFDRTIEFTLADDRSHMFGKDPDDQLFHAFDLTADSTFGASVPMSVGAPVVAGVAALSTPAIQGKLIILKIGGMDLADGAANWCELPVIFANSEKVVRRIYFNREDH
jgi:hypothetical protein